MTPMTATRKRIHAGFTIMELLALLPLLAVALVMAGALTPAILKHIPSTARAVQTHGQIAGILAHLQQDMDDGVSLPAPATQPVEAGDKTDEQTLLIQTRQGLVRWQIGQGQVTRTIDSPASAEPQVWTVRDGIIRLRWIGDGPGGASAIEVHTAVAGHADGRAVERLANSHLYFLNALRWGRVTK